MYYAKFTFVPTLYSIIPFPKMFRMRAIAFNQMQYLSNEFMKKFPFTELDIIYIRRKLPPKFNSQ